LGKKATARHCDVSGVEKRVCLANKVSRGKRGGGPALCCTAGRAFARGWLSHFGDNEREGQKRRWGCVTVKHVRLADVFFLAKRTRAGRGRLPRGHRAGVQRKTFQNDFFRDACWIGMTTRRQRDKVGAGSSAARSFTARSETSYTDGSIGMTKCFRFVAACRGVG